MPGYDRQSYADSCHEPVVYLVRAVSGGPVKIGHSNNVHTRLNNIQPGNPEKLECLAVLSADVVSETDLHQQFASNRIHGEWFHAVPEIGLVFGVTL